MLAFSLVPLISVVPQRHRLFVKSIHCNAYYAQYTSGFRRLSQLLHKSLTDLSHHGVNLFQQL